MAVDLTFAGALIDGSELPGYSRTRILGVRLRKFCLWHRLLLKAIESPFVTGKPVALIDLRRAVGICRLRFGDSRIVKPSARWMVAKAFLASFRYKPASGEDNPLQRALRKQCEMLKEYCGDYLQEPEYTIIPPKSNSTQTPRGRGPEEFEHVCDIINWSKWPEWYVWEMPIGKANYYRARAQRDSGLDVDFVDATDKTFREKLSPTFKRKH